MDPRLVAGKGALRGPSGLRIRFAAGTDPGRMRERNEDAFGAFVPGGDRPLPVDAALLVSDGVGGHQGGQEASRFTVDAVGDTLASLESVEDPTALLDALLHGIHRELLRQADERGMRGGMGATITLALLLGDRMYLAQVGDSRGYLLRDGELIQLTRDDSWVAERDRVAPGEGGEGPAPFGKNVLTQCLGIGPSLRVQVVPVQARPGDRYLLCSDGLHGPMADPEIQEVLVRVADPHRAVESLLEGANAAGGPDNIAAVVFDVGPPFPAQARPARGPGGTLPEGIPQEAGTTLPGGSALPARPLTASGGRGAAGGNGRASNRAGSVLVGVGAALLVAGSVVGIRVGRADADPGAGIVPAAAPALSPDGAPSGPTAPRVDQAPVDPAVGLPETPPTGDTASSVAPPTTPTPGDTSGAPDTLAAPDSTSTPDPRPDSLPGDTTLVSPDSIADGADTVPTPPGGGLPHQE